MGQPTRRHIYNSKNWLAQNYLPGINRLAKNYPAQPVITPLSSRKVIVLEMA